MTVGAPRLTPRTARELSALLYRWTGIRIQGKHQMIEGRLVPTLRSHRLGFTQYIQRVEDAGPNSPDAIEFINALTTNKTSFFREPHHFDFVRDHLLPQIARRAVDSGKRVVRLWSAACSTGEEPYSLAMLVHSVLPASSGWDVKILGTDIDTNVIEHARRATYDREIAASVPASLAARCFTDPDRDGRVTIRPEVARLVQFARANLIAEPFPVRGSFHAVFCRNVMIYFDRPTQDRIVANLTARLQPEGVLVVGHSESLVASHLHRVPATFGVYQLRESASASSASAATVAPSRPPVPRAPVLAPRRTPPARRPRTPSARTPHQNITIGEVAASASPKTITTLLGSCVAACLYDPVAKLGGMNHFLLPRTTIEDAAPGRFGVHAMELLMNKLLALGAERSRVVAKVFGAARVSNDSLSMVAETNAAFIREFLARECIPLVVERLGGTLARQITMHTETGAVEVRTIKAPERMVARELGVVEEEPAATEPCDVDALLF